MPDYTLLSLPCWSHCGATFSGMVEMQEHHLACHETPLHGTPVAVWMQTEWTQPPTVVAEPPLDAFCACGCVYEQHAIYCDDLTHACLDCDCPAFSLAQEVTPLPPMPPCPDPMAYCTCGCLYEVHRGITAELPLQPCLNCSCRAFVLRLRQEMTPPPQEAVSVLHAFLGIPRDVPTDAVRAAIDAAWRNRPGAIDPPVDDSTPPPPQEAPPADCPVCLHRYPAFLFCSRCGPDCARCVEARAALPALAPGRRRMWQVNKAGNRYNDHIENSVCVGAGCVPVEGTP